VQEALIAAAEQWPRDGVPDNPRGWLITVASRRLTDLLRAEQARRRREDTVAAWAPPADAPGTDDTLVLLFLCCHPVLPPAMRVALTLRAVGGLGTAEIGRAFFVPANTMAQRISRAKRRIQDSGVPFRLPAPAERADRLAAVLRVLYLIFTEGYAATSGPRLVRPELATEAIRLARLLHRLLPSAGEVTALLALLLLTDARRAARTGPDGALVPLAEQDRGRWDRALIDEGLALVAAAGGAGPYRLQAAVAALHAEAPTAADTDWPQIAALYRELVRVDASPMAALNHAVAVAMADGPAAGLALLGPLAADPRLADHQRLHAVRGHLLELAGDRAGAREAYRRAAARAGSLPERRYLHGRADRLG
jgi:predicted RNA polymerase sigma factor